MLAKIFDTLRVLVEGPDTKEDQELIPSVLFSTRESFNDAVVELLEKANIENIFDFLKYTICIDTSIRHRLDEDSGGYIDGALIQPDDYLSLLNTIDSTFGVTEETFGINVISGTQHKNPNFAGLSGAFLQIVQESFGDDQYDVFKGFVEANLLACATNPSASSIWWLDALKEIYSYERSSEDDSWFNPEEDVDQNKVIQIWYLDLTNALGVLFETVETALQTLPEHSLGNQLIELQMDNQANFFEDFEDKFENGHICKRIPLLAQDHIPHNIEQCLGSILAGV